jgi:hypothetical protein
MWQIADILPTIPGMLPFGGLQKTGRTAVFERRAVVVCIMDIRDYVTCFAMLRTQGLTAILPRF